MKKDHSLPQDRPIGPSLIIEIGVRIMIPFIQLFGLYVIAHGHYSPGGGFQGGVVLGASFILMAIAFDLKTSLRFFSLRANAIMAASGVFIYSGTAVLCALVGGLFLDYSALDAIIHARAGRMAVHGGVRGRARRGSGGHEHHGVTVLGSFLGREHGQGALRWKRSCRKSSPSTTTGSTSC